MGKLLGASAVIQVNGTVITTYCNQTDFNRVCNLLDSHTFGDTSVEKVPGLADATVRMGGPFDDANATVTNIELVLNSCYTASLPGGTGFTINIYPAGSASNKAYYTGVGFLGNEGIGLPVGGLETWQADLQFSGGASRSTVV